jgi:glycine/D-amino acid oxidase-like deaminating enzyme
MPVHAADELRQQTLRALSSETFDAVVVGGGATGLGIALDAALRGHKRGYCSGISSGCGSRFSTQSNSASASAARIGQTERRATLLGAL